MSDIATSRVPMIILHSIVAVFFIGLFIHMYRQRHGDQKVLFLLALFGVVFLTLAVWEGVKKIDTMTSRREMETAVNSFLGLDGEIEPEPEKGKPKGKPEGKPKGKPKKKVHFADEV